VTLFYQGPPRTDYEIHYVTYQTWATVWVVYVPILPLNPPEQLEFRWYYNYGMALTDTVALLCGNRQTQYSTSTDYPVMTRCQKGGGYYGV
jgi:hypothetical protein